MSTACGLSGRRVFSKSVQTLDADVLGLQETKLQEDQLTRRHAGPFPATPPHFAFASVKKGLQRRRPHTPACEPLASTSNAAWAIERFDSEGRIIEMDLGDVVFFNIYFPKRADERRAPAVQAGFLRCLFHLCGRPKARQRSQSGDQPAISTRPTTRSISRIPKPTKTAQAFCASSGTGWIGSSQRGYVDTFPHSLSRDRGQIFVVDLPLQGQRTIMPDGVSITLLRDGHDLVTAAGSVESAYHRQCDIVGSDHCPVGVVLEGIADGSMITSRTSTTPWDCPCAPRRSTVCDRRPVRRREQAVRTCSTVSPCIAGRYCSARHPGIEHVGARPGPAIVFRLPGIFRIGPPASRTCRQPISRM